MPHTSRQSSSTEPLRLLAIGRYIRAHVFLVCLTVLTSSDIWAVGCTAFFLIAGTPPFAAINDYHSFRKIETLDYTFPEGFYGTAKDLVQRLVVRLHIGWRGCLHLTSYVGPRPV